MHSRYVRFHGRHIATSQKDMRKGRPSHRRYEVPLLETEQTESLSYYQFTTFAEYDPINHLALSSRNFRSSELIRFSCLIAISTKASSSSLVFFSNLSNLTLTSLISLSILSNLWHISDRNERPLSSRASIRFSRASIRFSRASIRFSRASILYSRRSNLSAISEKPLATILASSLMVISFFDESFAMCTIFYATKLLQANFFIHDFPSPILHFSNVRFSAGCDIFRSRSHQPELGISDTVVPPPELESVVSVVFCTSPNLLPDRSRFP